MKTSSKQSNKKLPLYTSFALFALASLLLFQFIYHLFNDNAMIKSLLSMHKIASFKDVVNQITLLALSVIFYIIYGLLFLKKRIPNGLLYLIALFTIINISFSFVPSYLANHNSLNNISLTKASSEVDRQKIDEQTEINLEIINRELFKQSALTGLIASFILVFTFALTKKRK